MEPARDLAHLLTVPKQSKQRKKKSKVFSPDISDITNDSLYSEKTLFVLSAHSGEVNSQVQDLLTTSWQHAQKSTKPHVRDLAIVRGSFPWSGEHPAHTLFVSIMELRDLAFWEAILRNTLYEGGKFTDITTSTHIADLLERMAYPGRLGTYDFMSKRPLGQHMDIVMPLFRAYLFDMAASASERSKLGLARPLTAQDRYELLRCLWRCQQGLASDLDVQKHTRVWVYLNEAENVLDYAPAERKTLLKGLAHLMAHTSHFLTVWLNIAVQEQEMIQAVRSAFGASLLDSLDVDFTTIWRSN
jgi:hypothetical protein